MLQTDEKSLKNHNNVMKKTIKQIWIAENPIKCACQNYLFFDYIQDTAKIKVGRSGRPIWLT